MAANQLVTATLLRREGHQVEIASSGEAAVQAVRHTPYDLVFMDIFLPGLNGLETTREIRAVRGPTQAMTILALTANVAEEDRAIVRQAGMDGLLRKPVALSELQEAIARHVWRGMPEHVYAAMIPRPPARARDDAAAVLATERIEELRANLPADTLNNMIEECLDDLEHRVPALRRALEGGSLSEIVAQTHAMAGMAAGYGMAGLETKLRELMAANHDTGDRGPAGWAADLDATLHETARALRAAMQQEMA